jgi:hypothetical protein
MMMKQAVEDYLNKLLHIDQLHETNKQLENRIKCLEDKVESLEKSNEDLSKSIAMVAIIQANLLKELQNVFNSSRKTTQPFLTPRKTDDYTN